MLSFLPRAHRTCEGLDRRRFLEIGTLAGLGLSLPQFLAHQQAAAAEGRARSTNNCILIWTRGGTSHHDTFDPKPTAPASVKGPLSLINTAIPGIQFMETVPNMARELNRFALLRSWNPQNGSHGTADQWVMSGRKFNPAVTYPCYGSVISHQQGFKTAMPPFVQLGRHVDRRFGGGSSGILGLEHMPFEMLADPNAENFSVRDITPPQGIGFDRIERRRSMLSALDATQKAAVQPAAYNALDEHYEAAMNMITAPETKRAFLVEEEDPRLRDRFGRNTFGQSCLLARRLIQSGVRFVTVTDGGWDTHADNFNALRDRLMPRIDQGIPALLTDLEQQGMLDSTLVVWLTDFGRTPKINSASGRDHWASSGFAVMAGAGVPGGAVLGATDDEGGRPIRNEYLSENIAATIYSKLGLDPELSVQSPDGRPIRLIEGHPIHEWM